MPVADDDDNDDDDRDDDDDQVERMTRDAVAIAMMRVTAACVATSTQVDHDIGG